MDHMLVFRLGWWSFNDLLNGRLWFTCDSEGSATHRGRFGVLGVVTVRGRRVDGNATVIAEALEVAVSHINLAWNNVQLPTPHLSPYLNTDSLFIQGFPSIIQRSSCPTQMPLDPYSRITRT